jgi:hypothetical protein
LRHGTSIFAGIFPHVISQVHNEVSLGVMVRVTNDRPRAYFVVLRCAFNAGEREISVNEVVLNRMAPYEVLETYVGSSRWTRFDTRIICEITDESSPVP